MTCSFFRVRKSVFPWQETEAYTSTLGLNISNIPHFTLTTSSASRGSSYQHSLTNSIQSRRYNDDVYLVENGEKIWLYLSTHAPPSVRQDLLGLEGIPHKIDPSKSELAQKVHNIIGQIRKDRAAGTFMELRVVLPGSPEEVKLFEIMAEDRVGGEMPHFDFVCHIHKLVRTLSDELF